MHLKYIELLEKRIGQLEVLVNKSADVTSKVTSEVAVPATGDNIRAEQPKSRYRNILRKWDKMTGDYKEDVVEASRFDKPPRKEFAYSFRRTYDPETGERDAYSDIEVEDDKLIDLLKEVIGKYPGMNYDTEMLTLGSPFPAIIHHCGSTSYSVKPVGKAPENGPHRRSSLIPLIILSRICPCKIVDAAISDDECLTRGQPERPYKAIS